MIDRETRFYSIRMIVRTLHGLCAAFVTHALFCRRLKHRVIGGAAAPADASAGKPLGDFFIAYFNIDDLINKL